MATEAAETCPCCEGTSQRLAISCGPDGFRETVSTCNLCGGSGTIASEPAGRYRIVVMGNIAFGCNAHLKRARHVFVEGRSQTREWENNGQNSRRTEIVSTRVHFFGFSAAGRQ
jgi:single-strand DNA-binding protein